jgi:MarR family transcriptional regulator, negative regulator of the multidrug operon emrRAB
MTARQANLLGALVLSLGDRLQTATEASSGRGGQAPSALAVLAQQDGLGIEGLRAQLGLSQPATVRLVDALVADGLAVRRPGRDARSLALTLTAAGRRRADRLLGERRGVLDSAMSELSTSERRGLEALLDKILARLTSDRDEADVICRLCDLAACPRSSCPVECAVAT